MRDFWEGVLVIGYIAALCVTLLGVLFGAIAVFNRIECGNLSEITKRQTIWRFFGGCYVEHEGEMLPYDRWILLDVRVKERK